MFTLAVLLSLLVVTSIQLEQSGSCESTDFTDEQCSRGLPNLSEEDLVRLRRVFPMSLLKDSPIGRIVRGERMPTVAMMEKLRPQHLAEELGNNEHYAASFREFIKQHDWAEQVRLGRESSGNTFKETRLDSEEREEGEQVGGYEGCKRDYDTLTFPILTSLVYNMLSDSEICETLGPLGETFPFCDCDISGPGQGECSTNSSFFQEPPALNSTAWSRQMLDALAKVPPGLSDGRVHWVGGFAMCIAVDDNYTYVNNTYFEEGIPIEERHVQGKYCRLMLGLGASLNISIPLGIGLCVPGSCNSEHIVYYLTNDNPVFMALGLVLDATITLVACKEDSYPEEDPLYVAAMAIVLVFFILVGLATVYDVILRPKYFASKHYGPESTEAISQPPGSCTVTDDDKVQGVPTEMDAGQLRGYLGRSSEVSADMDDLQRQRSISRQTSTAALVTQPSVEQNEDRNSLTWGERAELLFVGFSGYSNIQRLMDMSSPVHHIPVLDGVRVLSFAWAALGGAYFWGPVYTDCLITANLLRAIRELPGRFSFQPVLNFAMSMDSFFVISGTLLTYWWLKHLEASANRLNVRLVAYYILHRYWRIIPVYMMILFIYHAAYLYSGDGPFFAHKEMNDGANCGINWWTNMLLIMNLVNNRSQCLGYSWYTSVLFQLHVVTLVVLLPMAIKPMVGYIILGLLYLLHVGLAAWISYSVYEDTLFDWYYDYLQAPWCRAGPFFVGLILGIVLHKYRKITLHWSIVLGGWCMSIVCVTTPIYCTYGQFKEGGEMWDKSRQVAYDTLARTALGLGVAWIIFACHYGYGSIVTTLLTFRVYRPLSKLTYCAFLVHVLTNYIWAYSRQTDFFISDLNMIWLFLAELWVAYVMGALVMVVLHYPLSSGIERSLVCKTRPRAMQAGRYPGDFYDQYLVEQARKASSGIWMD